MFFPHKVAHYIDDAKRLTAARFSEVYPFPVLLHRVKELSPGSTSFGTHESDAGSDHDTVVSGGKQDLELAVLNVRKRPGNAFDDTVTLGRIASNDVVLPYAEISKFHCHFTWSPDHTQYFLSDSGSKHGTRVGQEKAGAKKPLALANESLIVLRAYRFLFCFPAGFHRIVLRAAAE